MTAAGAGTRNPDKGLCPGAPLSYPDLLFNLESNWGSERPL